MNAAPCMAQNRPDVAEAPQRPPKRSLGYSFVATPTFVSGLIRDGRLKPIDSAVLGILLRFNRRLVYSCWCAKHTIAAKLGRTTRTVQTSLKRLADAGVIHQELVEQPDPDDPNNHTGWRIVFLWIAPSHYRPGPGPDRRRPEERKVWARIDDGGRKSVSSPPPPLEPLISSDQRTIFSSEGENPISSKDAGASKLVLDGMEPDGNDDDAPAPAPLPGPSSSSDASTQEEEPRAEAPGPPASAELATVVEKARALWPDDSRVENRIQAVVKEFSLPWVNGALDVAKQASRERTIHFSYVRGILANWRDEGTGPAPEPIKKPSASQLAEADRLHRIAEYARQADEAEAEAPSAGDIAEAMRFLASDDANLHKLGNIVLRSAARAGVELPHEIREALS